MSKRGFSMVELLVVIGIIGILGGVLFASFGGATDSARAAQCLTNLRGLAMAATSNAMLGGYPLAGSREVYGAGADGDNAGRGYFSQRGWISWLGENYKSLSAHRGYPTFPFTGTGKKEDEMFAFTNGVMWAASGQNRQLYTCPQHIRYREEKKLSPPCFSYVMSARFGWDYTKGSGPCEGTPTVEFELGFSDLPNMDRVLMFAELPTEPVQGQVVSEQGIHADCTLQYLDVKPKSGEAGDRMASPAGDAESIGFVHKVGKRLCAHVAFADGHVEKLVWGERGVDAKTLTAYLCKGWDVTFDSADGWQLSKDASDFGDVEEDE